jgi:hypothetical protein
MNSRLRVPILASCTNTLDITNHQIIASACRNGAIVASKDHGATVAIGGDKELLLTCPAVPPVKPKGASESHPALKEESVTRSKLGVVDPDQRLPRL